MKLVKTPLFVLLIVALSALACSNPFNAGSPPDENIEPDPEYTLPDPVVEPGYDPSSADPDEPILVTGTIPFTSPFFINLTAEPFVLLEDQAGFYQRDEDFVFPLAGQSIGPVWKVDDQTFGFSLALPSVPQGTFLDVDNNGQEDRGVMIFQVAFWSNTWGGPFLEEREGTGWSGAYTSALTDIERDGEIYGGTLVVWAPDDQQSFPTGFGPDELLFTEDDPVTPIPAGYSLVNLNETPFRIYKESVPELTLVEGASEVKDFSSLNRLDAFDAMFERVRLEYPFTTEKNIDWDALYAEFAPRIEAARSTADFYIVMKDFTMRIPDGHVGMSFTDDASRHFFETNGGSLGIILAELGDGRVIVTEVLSGFAAAGAGIEPGAEILQWQGQPVAQAIAQVEPYFGPYSTEQALRFEQLVFLTRFAPDSQVSLSFRNPGGPVTEAVLTATVEYDSLFAWIPYFVEDPLALPIEAEELEDGIAYLKINTFSGDYNLMAQVFEYHIEQLIENDIDRLIIDLRLNLGGSGGLARDFISYFINEEIEVSRHAYYNEDLGEFEYGDEPATIEPGPLYYDGEIVVLVSTYCVSACEGFAYWLSLNDRAVILGHTGTAGAYGEVGRGQYTLPGELDLQVPTGRPETLDGDLLIEGTGVIPDIIIPLTYEGALGLEDTLLEAAEDRLRN